MEGHKQTAVWSITATTSMQAQVKHLQSKMDTRNRTEVVRRALQTLVRLHDSQSVWIEEPSGVMKRVEL